MIVEKDLMLSKAGEEYTHEKHFKVRVYRITMTNVDGFVHEFSAREVQQYCLSRGLVPVEEFYYGYARDLYDNEIIEDENLARLVTFPNVLITSHMGFFTTEAMQAIAIETMENAYALEHGLPLLNQVGVEVAI